MKESRLDRRANKGWKMSADREQDRKQMWEKSRRPENRFLWIKPDFRDYSFELRLKNDKFANLENPFFEY